MPLILPASREGEQLWATNQEARYANGRDQKQLVADYGHRADAFGIVVPKTID